MITKAYFRSLLEVNADKVRGKRLRRLVQPDAVRSRYTTKLQKTLLADMWAQVQKQITPNLDTWASQASRLSQDAVDDTVDVAVDKARAQVAKKWSRTKVAQMVTPIARDLEVLHTKQMNAQMREVVGVDVVGSESWLSRAVEEFTAENVALIKTIPSRFFDEIETTLQRGLADGLRPEQLSQGLQDRYGVSQSRAELIARDQAGKFYGDLNRVRQVDLGIDGFVWRTSNDERVRDEHVALNGQSFKWSDLPSEGAPGEPIQCRCNAEPDLTSMLAEPAPEQGEQAPARELVEEPVAVVRAEEPEGEEPRVYPVGKEISLPLRVIDDVSPVAYNPDRAIPIIRSLLAGEEIRSVDQGVKISTDTNGFRFAVDGNHRTAVAQVMGAERLPVTFKDKPAARNDVRREKAPFDPSLVEAQKMNFEPVLRTGTYAGQKIEPEVLAVLEKLKRY